MNSCTLAEFYQKERLSYTLKHLLQSGTLRKFGSYLPNLRYKNGNIYYYSSNPIKFKSFKSKSGHYYQSEFKLKDLELFGKMNIYNNIYYIEIIPKYLKDGLEICVKYSDQYDILHPMEKTKIARAIEYQILGINMFKDYYEKRTFNNDDNFNIDDILYDHLKYFDINEINNSLNNTSENSSDITLEEDYIQNTLSFNIDLDKHNYENDDNDYDYDSTD